MLGVSPRTVRRWFEGEEVPGPAEAAVRAWRRLAERHLPWKPDSVSIVEDDQDQIARHRLNAIGLSDLLTRVDARGGARIPWTVNMAECSATLGPAEVGFYKLQNEGFSVSAYRRTDTYADVQRDWSLIEDAIFCIAIEFENCRLRAAALGSAAEDIRRNSAFFVTNGPRSLAPDETARQRLRIEALADQTDALAMAVLEGRAKYQEFEAILSDLRKNGFTANDGLVSAVAQAFVVGVSRPKSMHPDQTDDE